MKNKANAGQKKNPRNPEISFEGLASFKEALGDSDLLKLAYRFETFENLRQQEKLNTPFIALEALSALAGGLVSGRSEEQLQTTWPENWGRETMTVPLALVLALSAGWRIYRSEEEDRSLGEVLEIEAANHQGSHPMKSIMATEDDGLKYANDVLIKYLSWAGNEDPKNVEDAISEVAQKHGKSEETVRKAYRKNKHTILFRLKEVRILKG